MTKESEQALYELSLSDESLFQQILKRCWDEVLHRLECRPATIEDTHLYRLFSEMNKMQAQIAQREGPKELGKTENILNLILVPGLPFERQKDLLLRAIQDLEGRGLDTSDHRAALEQLVGSNNADKLLAIEGGTEDEDSEGA